MNFKVYFNVVTSVSTSSGPLPGVSIGWNGDNGSPVSTDADGNANCVVTGQPGNKVGFTATKDDYSTQTLSLELGTQNDADHPLQFQLQGYGWIPCGKCFIVSAATGSPDSEEVRRMQQMRARVATASALGGQLIQGTLREYYEFSPAIAADIEKDESARAAILRLIVRPLMAWYGLAVALGLESPDAETVSRYVRALRSTCAGDARHASIAATLQAIRSGFPMPADAPAEILPFVDKARHAGKSGLVSWAILEPLIRMWSLEEGKTDVVEEVFQWLGDAPIETLSQPPNAEVLNQELERLSRFFDFRPAARQRVGIRLASAWPDAIPALAKNRFLS